MAFAFLQQSHGMRAGEVRGGRASDIAPSSLILRHTGEPELDEVCFRILLEQPQQVIPCLCHGATKATAFEGAP